MTDFINNRTMDTLPIGQQLDQGYLPDGFEAVPEDGAEVIEGPAMLPADTLPADIHFNGARIGKIAVTDRFDPSSLSHRATTGFHRY